MVLEPTITYGTLFTVGSSLIGVFFTCLFFVWTLRGRVDNLTMQMGNVVVEISAMRKIMETQARHDERLLAVERRIDATDRRVEELRHGEGMVLPFQPNRRVFEPGT